ncbi:hypothetical protein [Methylomarinum vadi]|uniref:hypothetical protein n=1 Tax=Methylomarinum vadi TaxID=438855 RepID=UPI0004DF4893|nr:hypothetical protein [Methylomarinum vadi]
MEANRDENLLHRAGFKKHSGTPIDEVFYALTLWLKKASVEVFVREGLQGGMGKDVLYDTMKREDLNWRKREKVR